MLPTRTHGTQGPLVVFLHWLGGSARTWTEVGENLAARGMTTVAIDLPGFGDAANIAGYSPAETAAAVIATIRDLRSSNPSAPWFLGGHSMGGKIAMLVARSAVDGAPGLEGLRALIMTSPSTPEPEPMKNSRRDELLATMGHSSGDAAEDRHYAEKMVDGGIGKLPLPPAIRERTIADVLRLNRAALRAWLEEGSKEDCGPLVGVLPLPALIFAGDSERALGPETQQNVTLPHFASGQLLVLEGAGHHSPIERPDEVCAHVVDFVQSLGITLHPITATLDPTFQQLLDSPRTSPQTRAVMQARLAADKTPAPPQVLTLDELHTLRALAETVIPDAGLDLAARLDHKLASTPGDGWRYDALPTDIAAWKQGLASLDAAAHRAHGVAFLAITPDLRHELLLEAQQGKLGRGVLGTLHLGESAQAFTADQMQRWFEDVRGELTRLYVSDPRTVDRIGFTGFADDPKGFTQIRLEDQSAPIEEFAELAEVTQ
jgi:pimeloyl-ACP methyl ester carboxylesterase